MSAKNRIDDQLKRAQADVAAALERPVAAPEADNDVELEAAERLVKEGKLAGAYRTRNGTLVTTKGAITNETELHRLQENGALI